MDTLGIEPRASRMLSGCDTTTPCALNSCELVCDVEHELPPRLKRQCRDEEEHTGLNLTFIRNTFPCGRRSLTCFSRAKPLFVFVVVLTFHKCHLVTACRDIFSPNRNSGVVCPK